MSLLEELRQAGRLDSRGLFTLDRAKARQKMARFQLTDPRRYVLELVEAAVVLGSEALDLELGGTLEVRFGGQPLPAEGLAALDDHLLTVPTGPVGTALRALAMACAALETLSIQHLRLESPSGFWLERAREGESSGPGVFSCHRLLVEGASPGRSRNWPEEALLAGEARYAPIPIRIGGRDVRLPPDLRGLGPVRSLPPEGPPRFRAVVSREGEASALTLVSRGVVVGRRSPSLAVPLQAVAWHEDLGRNASHSDVVEDHRLTALLEDLSAFGAACAEALAASLGEDGLGQEAEESKRVLVHLACGWKGDLPESFMAAPLLQDHLGGALSLAELQAQLQGLGQVPVCWEPPHAADLGFRIARLRHSEELHLLRFCFGEAVQDAGERVLQVLRRRNHRQRWECSPRPATLPPGEWIVRRSLQDPPGEVGLSPQDTDVGSLLHVLYRGRLLESRELATPLSYVAVLDFQDLEIEDDWSAASDTASFRKALERLDHHGEELYEELAARGGPWTPAECDHLELAFEMWGERGRMPPEPLRSLPWFAEMREGMVSLDRLVSRPTVFLVEPEEVDLPLDLPEPVWPDAAFVRTDSLARRVLEGILPGRVSPAAPELARLSELALRFRTRRQPVLPESGELLVRVEVASGSARGQLGIVTGGERGILHLLREGVFLQTRTLTPTGPPFEAVMECPRLQPAADWKAIQTDQAWSEVLALVREAETRAGVLLAWSWHQGRLPVQARTSVQVALRTWPDLAEKAAAAPLFLTAEGLVSLDRLRGAVEQGEELLTARDLDLEAVPGKLVLPESECALIRQLLPRARFASARPWLDAQRARAEFLLRPPHPLRLSERTLARRALRPPLEGEVALVEAGGGEVQVLLEGRLLQHLSRVLPPTVQVVVQAPGVQPDARYRQVLQDEAWEELLQSLAAEVGLLARELLDGLPRPGSDEARALLSLLAWPALPESVRAALEEAPLLRVLPDQALGLAEVRRRMGRKPFLLVSPRFGIPRDGRLVVQADADLQLVLRAVLKRNCRDDSENLARDAQYLTHLKKAARLPRRLSGCLLVLSVEGASLTGEIGFPARARRGSLVALHQGQPLGQLEMPHHLSQAIVEGSFRLDAGGALLPLTRDQRRELREHQVRLYGLLAQRHPDLSGRDREQAREALLAFALEERSALGGRSPAGEVLERILALPLVEVVGGRQVSLAALLAEDQARGRLVCVSRKPLWNSSNQEELLPILPAGSPVRELCTRLLGQAHLEEVSSPGLGQVLTGALQAANRSRTAASAWWGNTLERLGERLNAPVFPDASERKASAAATEVESGNPEAELLKALRREFALVARGQVRKRGSRRLESLDWGLRPLGPPVWVSRERVFLNRAHGTIRWIRDHFVEDPALVSLLLAHLVGLLNEADDAVDDPDEREFLQELIRDLHASFPD